MIAQAETGRWEAWVPFLAVTAAVILAWDSFLHFAFGPFAFGAGTLMVLLLFFPFAAALLFAYLFIWRRRPNLGEKALSVIAATVLVLGVARLIALFISIVYPVPIVGIP